MTEINRKIAKLRGMYPKLCISFNWYTDNADNESGEVIIGIDRLTVISTGLFYSYDEAAEALAMAIVKVIDAEDKGCLLDT